MRLVLQRNTSIALSSLPPDSNPVIVLVDAQTIGVLVTAASVTVAAIYYIMTLRINQRNGRITLTNNIMQSILTKENQKDFGELMNMTWVDYDDFEKKYGSDYNLDNFAKRMSAWSTYDALGNLLRQSLADLDTIYNSGTICILWTWVKFKPVIEEHRRRYGGKDAFNGFEYLGDSLMRLKKLNDPGFKFPAEFTRYIPEK